MSIVHQSRVLFQPWADPGVKPYIRIINVTKSFSSGIAVDDISLDIYQREFHTLLGPSGCGKTTLLRMLAGFETPTSGRIEIDGIDMSTVPPYDRPVNMMFQSYALFPHMNVEQNIAFGLKQDRVPKAEIARRVEEMLTLVQLTSFASRRPHQLSGGQRQRVALARSLVKKPKMLLLDEPMGALDKKLREQTRLELMNIQETVGITFLIVTHDQEEAMSVSSRIAVMNLGRIAQVATPIEIYEYPASRYIASFIGDVNMFEGRVTSSTPDHTIIESAEAETSIYVHNSPSVTNTTTVWVAVRPEKLDITLEPPPDPSHNCLKGTVWDIGYLGSLTVYHVRLENGKRIIATQANKFRITERKITWNDLVYLHWQLDSAVVLVS